MKSLSRRDFLKYAGLGTAGIAAAAALAACGGNNAPAESGGTTASTAPASSGSTSTAIAEQSTVKTQAEVVDVAARKFTSVTLGMGGDPGTLQPYSPGGAGRNECRLHLFQTLCVLAPATSADYPNLRNVMITGYEKTGENQYDVTLKENIFDSEGNHITASDVVYSYDLAVASGYKAQLAQQYESSEAVSDYVVRFHLKQDEMGSMETILSGEGNIVSQKAWENSPDEMTTTPVGTAPWYLDDWQLGAFYTFKRREDYWNIDGTDKAEVELQNVDQINYEIIKDNTTSGMALENFEIDQGNVSNADLGNFVDPSNYTPREGYNSILYPANNGPYLSFNCSEDSICSDINLRKAIALCIDNAAAGELVLGARYVKVKGFMITPWKGNCVDLLPEDDYYNYDPELAKEYLDKSSYDGRTINALVNPAYKDLAVMIQAYAKDIGIDFNPVLLESALYEAEHISLDSTKYDLDIVFSRGDYVWAPYQDLSATNFTNGLSHNFIKDDELERLFAQAKKADMTPEDALALHDYVKEQCYAYMIYSAYSFKITTDKVTNIVSTMTSLIPGACTVVADEDWPHMSTRKK